MVLEQLHIWHNQYPSGQCTSAGVECCGLKGRRGGQGRQQRAGVGALTQEPAVVVHETGAGRPTLAVENSYAVYRGGGSPVMVLPVSPPPRYNEL